MPQALTEIGPLLDGNFCGFSNTGLNLKTIKLDQIINQHAEIVVPDWWLFSSLILKGYKGKKITETTTYYRVYDENVAGPMFPLDVAKLKHVLKIKIGQYIFFAARYPELYAERLNRVLAFEAKIADAASLQRELAELNRVGKGQQVIWWDIFNKKKED